MPIASLDNTHKSIYLSESLPNINGIALHVNDFGLRELNERKGAAGTAPFHVNG
jgi:hypothetical protein